MLLNRLSRLGAVRRNPVAAHYDALYALDRVRLKHLIPTTTGRFPTIVAAGSSRRFTESAFNGWGPYRGTPKSSSCGQGPVSAELWLAADRRVVKTARPGQLAKPALTPG